MTEVEELKNMLIRTEYLLDIMIEEKLFEDAVLAERLVGDLVVDIRGLELKDNKDGD